MSILQSYNLIPCLDKPTRVHSAYSASLIDNIFTNTLSKNFVSGNIVSDITDHYSQFYISECASKTICTNSKQRIRDFSRFNEADFLNDVTNIRWIRPNSEQDCDVDKLFSTFYNKFNNIINRRAPLKLLSKRKRKQLTKPWITKGLRKSIKIKNSLFYSGDIERYKMYRNKILSLTRFNKKMFYHTYFEKYTKNIKMTWKGINEITGRKRSNNNVITKLRCPDKTISENPEEIPNIINKYFASIGHNLASNLPASTRSYDSYLSAYHIRDSFAFQLVTPSEIETEILQTPNDKCYGLDSCPISLLKSARHLISGTLSYLLNTSILIGVYPSKLKYAKVIPIFKENDPLDSTNYRPISLLSIFNRIFEKVIYRQLNNFLVKYDIIFHSQYGFRKQHSTEHAILDITNTIQRNMDLNLYSCGVFLDLKKAFDTVDHTILIHKLQYYGFRGVINTWFQSYLTNRKQTTQIGNCLCQNCK